MRNAKHSAQTKNFRFHSDLFLRTTILLLLLALNQGCSQGRLSHPSMPSNNGVYVPAAGEMVTVDMMKAAAVNNSQQVLTAMVSLTGIGQPSSATLNAYKKEAGKISDTGKPDSVNAPMWLAITNLAGEVCRDLVTAEAALTIDQRRIFKQINFTTGGPVAIPDAAKSDVIRRLARSVWQRNETNEELGLLKAELATFKSTTAGDTNKAMLMTCTAMLASLDANDL